MKFTRLNLMKHDKITTDDRHVTVGAKRAEELGVSNCGDRTFRWLYHYVQDIRFSRCICIAPERIKISGWH